MQHILESELEGLEEVRFPRPRHELGSTISVGRERVNKGLGAPPHPRTLWVAGAPHLVILRVLEVQRAAAVQWPLRESERTEPRGASRGCSAGREAGQRDCTPSAGLGRPAVYLHSPGRPDSVTPVLTVTPDHVMSLSARPGVRPSVAGRHVHPDWRPGWGRTENTLVRKRAAAAGGARLARALDTHLVSNPSTEAPIPAPSPPALARLGHGLRRPVPRLVAASLQLLAPACAQLPPQFSLTLPRPPRLIWSRLCP